MVVYLVYLQNQFQGEDMGQSQANPQQNSCLDFLKMFNAQCKLGGKNCLKEDLELFEININQLFQSRKRVYSNQKANRAVSISQTESRIDEKQIQFTLKSQNKKQNDDSWVLLQHSCKRRLYLDNGKYALQDSIQTNTQTARSHQSQNKQNATSDLNLPSSISQGIFNSQVFSKRNKQTNSYLIEDIDSLISTPKQRNIYNSPGTEKWKDFLQNFNLKQQSIRLAKESSTQLQKNSLYINYQNSTIVANYSQIEPNAIKIRRYTNGDMIIGRYLDGIPEGQVKYLKNDGSFYLGQFIAGKAKGYGIYKDLFGFYYEGYWKNNYPDGFGKAVYQNKTVYEGSFILGKKHGKGVLQQPGYRYQGAFKNDLYQGDGTLFINGYLTYKGEWKDNLMDGFGQYYETNQQKYEGEFRKGKKYGYGVMTYSNGDIYEGHWKNNIRSGFGTLKTKQKLVSGSWVRNRLITQSQTTVSLC